MVRERPRIQLGVAASCSAVPCQLKQQISKLAHAAPMLDALAAGFKECKLKPIVGPKLQLDAFLDGMLRSRISRRIMAEQVCLVP